MQNEALIIIDVQRDYFPGGAMELNQPEKAVDQIQLLLNHFRENKKPVFHIQHTMPEWRNVPFMVKGTNGHEIYPEVAPQEGEVLIDKEYPNAFCKTTLHEQLKEAGVEELVICGMMTHMCVNSTARRAFELAYPTTVISDACATRDLEVEGKVLSAETIHLANLAALNGTVAKVVRAKTYLG